MIKDYCFTDDWLESFRRNSDHSKIDKAILEKMIYALHLVERLRASDLAFVFKGGTSLILLLNEDNRFSIDVDIICKTDRKEIEHVLQKVIDTSRFTLFSLDEHRSYLKGVPKAHYAFSFVPAIDENKYSGKILGSAINVVLGL
jgi:predicted nucleotidyltransferase component of viral defense system